MVQLSDLYMTTRKITALTIQTSVNKVMFLLFNMLASFSSKEKASFNFVTVITICSDFAAQENNLTVSTFSLSICYEVMGPDAMILVFRMLSFKSAFSLSSFTLNKRLFSSSSLSAIREHELHIWGCLYFSQKPWFQLVIHPAWHFTWCTLHSS